MTNNSFLFYIVFGFITVLLLSSHVHFISAQVDDGSIDSFCTTCNTTGTLRCDLVEDPTTLITTPTCICATNFTGVLCDIDNTSLIEDLCSVCDVNGTIHCEVNNLDNNNNNNNTDGSDDINNEPTSTCICDVNYSGEYCEIFTPTPTPPVDLCETKNCNTTGTLTCTTTTTFDNNNDDDGNNIQTTVAICNCLQDYSGELCNIYTSPISPEIDLCEIKGCNTTGTTSCQVIEDNTNQEEQGANQQVAICQCNEGFEGDLCEFEIILPPPVDLCQVKGCNITGTTSCIISIDENTQEDIAICQCNQDFEGDLCDIEIIIPPPVDLCEIKGCNTTGTANCTITSILNPLDEDTDNEIAICNCLDGFEGDLCDIESILPPLPPPPPVDLCEVKGCNTTGTLECVVVDENTGEEKKEEENNNQNNIAICKCKDYFNGDLCQNYTPPPPPPPTLCDLKQCNPIGTESCVEIFDIDIVTTVAQCNCAKHYYGEKCIKYIPNQCDLCNNIGTTSCTVTSNEAQAQPDATDLIITATCHCQTFFSGQYCEVDNTPLPDLCQTDCNPTGTKSCEIMYGLDNNQRYAQCYCEDNWGGKYCDISQSCQTQEERQLCDQCKFNPLTRHHWGPDCVVEPQLYDFKYQLIKNSNINNAPQQQQQQIDTIIQFNVNYQGSPYNYISIMAQTQDINNEDEQEEEENNKNSSFGPFGAILIASIPAQAPMTMFTYDLRQLGDELYKDITNITFSAMISGVENSLIQYTIAPSSSSSEEEEEEEEQKDNDKVETTQELTLTKTPVTISITTTKTTTTCQIVQIDPNASNSGEFITVDLCQNGGKCNVITNRCECNLSSIWQLGDFCEKSICSTLGCIAGHTTLHNVTDDECYMVHINDMINEENNQSVKNNDNNFISPSSQQLDLLFDNAYQQQQHVNTAGYIAKCNCDEDYWTGPKCNIPQVCEYYFNLNNKNVVDDDATTTTATTNTICSLDNGIPSFIYDDWGMITNQCGCTCHQNKKDNIISRNEQALVARTQQEEKEKERTTGQHNYDLNESEDSLPITSLTQPLCTDCTLNCTHGVKAHETKCDVCQCYTESSLVDNNNKNKKNKKMSYYYGKTCNCQGIGLYTENIPLNQAQYNSIYKLRQIIDIILTTSQGQYYLAQNNGDLLKIFENNNLIHNLLNIYNIDDGNNNDNNIILNKNDLIHFKLFLNSIYIGLLTDYYNTMLQFNTTTSKLFTVHRSNMVVLNDDNSQTTSIHSTNNNINSNNSKKTQQQFIINANSTLNFMTLRNFNVTNTSTTSPSSNDDVNDINNNYSMSLTFVIFPDNNNGCAKDGEIIMDYLWSQTLPRLTTLTQYIKQTRLPIIEDDTDEQQQKQMNNINTNNNIKTSNNNNNNQFTFKIDDLACQGATCRGINGYTNNAINNFNNINPSILLFLLLSTITILFANQ